MQYLKDAKLVDDKTITRPNKASHEDLLQVHSQKYLKSLKVCYFNCNPVPLPC